MELNPGADRIPLVHVLSHRVFSDGTGICEKGSIGMFVDPVSLFVCCPLRLLAMNVLLVLKFDLHLCRSKAGQLMHELAYSINSRASTLV